EEGANEPISEIPGKTISASASAEAKKVDEFRPLFVTFSRVLGRRIRRCQKQRGGKGGAMNRPRRMCNALVGRGAGLLLAAVFALFMVPHAALADTSAVATVVVDDVHDSTVLAPSCAPPPNVCSVFALPPAPTPIVQAQVIGAPGNLGRARIGKSPSVFANGVTVGVEARTQGASRRASATAEFSDGWACPGTCAFPASPPVPVLTGVKVNGVIHDLLANPALPLDQS